MFSRVIALCIELSIIFALAGQSTTSLRYAMSCMTCIKFHMAFSETARQIVTPN